MSIEIVHERCLSQTRHSINGSYYFIMRIPESKGFLISFENNGIYPKNPETPIQKNLCTPIFIAAQFAIAECWKQPKCPSVNEWIKKLWYIYTMEYYGAERKKELLPFLTA